MTHTNVTGRDYPVGTIIGTIMSHFYTLLNIVSRGLKLGSVPRLNGHGISAARQILFVISTVELNEAPRWKVSSLLVFDRIISSCFTI